MLFDTFFVLLVVFISTSGGKANANARSKRYLLTPASTQYGSFTTISVPLHPESTVSMAWFFEANYFTVANASYWHPVLGLEEETRSERDTIEEEPKHMITRKSVYTIIESLFERHGFEGRACLLRAICENTRSHFLHNGLLGDLLYLLLTPSTSLSENDIEDEFYVAEHLGIENKCHVYEAECQSNPLDYITIFL